MLKDKTAKILIITGACLIVAVFITWQAVRFTEWSGSEKLADGIKIGGYDLSGYDRSSAMQFLDIHFTNELSGQDIQIEYEDIKSTVNVGAFTKLSFENVLDEAYSIARTGIALNDFFALTKSHMVGTSFEPELVFDDDALKAQLTSISDVYSIAAQDASIASFDPDATEGEKLTVLPHSNGRKLDIEKTAESIKDAILSKKQSAKAYTAPAQAQVTDEQIMGITANTVISEYTISGISSEFENAIYQAIGSGIYEILMPGQQMSVIEFSGKEDYIVFDMPQDGSGGDYDMVLSQLIPTQIYIASTLSELQVTERKMYDLDAEKVPAGTSCIIGRDNDMTVKNTLSCPVIIRIGYHRVDKKGVFFCEIYRPEMKYKTLIRSVLKNQESKTFIDITRVYVDNRGNTVDSVVAETLEVS